MKPLSSKRIFFINCDTKIKISFHNYGREIDLSIRTQTLGSDIMEKRGFMTVYRIHRVHHIIFSITKSK